MSSISWACLQVAARTVVDTHKETRDSGSYIQAGTMSRSTAVIELNTPFAGTAGTCLKLDGAAAAAQSNAPWWLSPKLFALTTDGAYLISGGYWDSSFKVTSLNSGATTQSITGHTDVVTCVAMSSLANVYSLESSSADAPRSDSGRARRSAGPASVSPSMSTTRDVCRDVLVTGSLDAVVKVWEVVDGVVSPQPKHVLHGHDDVVSCVAVSAGYDLVASASYDGTVILHSLRKGQYLRTLVPALFRSVFWV